jgi:uncharacterized protein YoxC
MKQLKIDNPKIVEYLKEKDLIVRQGRKISAQIEKVDREISEHDELEKKITSEINPEELIDKGNALQREINAKVKELEALADQVAKAKMDGIPKEVMEKHYALRITKDKLEKERNKLALKVQKIKDRVVPMIKTLVKPMLAEYEDMETAKVVGKQVHVKVFSHLKEWKKNFSKRSGV